LTARDARGQQLARDWTIRWQSFRAPALPTSRASCGKEPAAAAAMQQQQGAAVDPTGPSIAAETAAMCKRMANKRTFVQAVAELREMILSRYEGCSEPVREPAQRHLLCWSSVLNSSVAGAAGAVQWRQARGGAAAQSVYITSVLASWLRPLPVQRFFHGGVRTAGLSAGVGHPGCAIQYHWCSC
jgi:hypothetical protein